MSLNCHAVVPLYLNSVVALYRFAFLPLLFPKFLITLGNNSAINRIKHFYQTELRFRNSIILKWSRSDKIYIQNIYRMAKKYYVAVRPRINENHAVHKEGCPFLNRNEKRIFLGVFNSSLDAVKASRRHFFSSEGCVFCSKEQKPHNLKTKTKELVEKELIPDEMERSSSFHQGLFYCVN